MTKNNKHKIVIAILYGVVCITISYPYEIRVNYLFYVPIYFALILYVIISIINKK